MKIYCFIFAFMLCHKLFSENLDQQFTHHNPIEISSMDTSGLDPKLKQFLDSFYQRNFSNYETIKGIKSIQYIGTYKINEKEAGTIKIIKKRPNKYKSYIKDKNDIEVITIYDGETLKSGKKTSRAPTIVWQTVDENDPKNSWIHNNKIFDSILLNPSDPDKKISLGIAYLEEGRVIQPITIELKNVLKITNLVSMRDNLIKESLIEFKNQEDPKLGNYNIYFEDYELANGIMTPKKITTKLYDGTIVVYEFTDIQINLGISDFFFKAISL